MFQITIRQRMMASALLILSFLFLGDAFAASATSEPREKDQAAIAAVMQSFVKAFEARDAKQLASHWTTECEFENARGVVVSGRDELEKSFAALFAKNPEASAKLDSDSVRFLSADTAIYEGTVAIRRGPTQPSTEADYTALLVREGGTWKLAQMSESSFDEAIIEDLAWLIGDWKTPGDQETQLLISYTWDPNKQFMHVKLHRTEEGLDITGTQIIGIDPTTGQFRSWTFEADGGIGEAHWSRDGDSWVLSAIITFADGQTRSETNVFRRIDDDTVTYQSIGRTLDDVQLPDLPPMKLTRVKK